MSVARGEPRAEKAAAVEEIQGHIRDAESTLLVEMHGLSVADATDLRRRLREADVGFKVYKNTLLRIAVDGLGIEGLGSYLTGPTAIAVSRQDPSTAMKILRSYMKTNESVRVKAGLIGTDVLDADDAERLADLPTYDEGVAMLAGVLQAPIAGLARALNSLIGGLAIALNRVVEAQEEVAPAE